MRTYVLMKLELPLSSHLTQRKTHMLAFMMQRAAAARRIRPAHLPSALYPEQGKHENKREERENNKCEKDSDSSIIFMNSTFRLAQYSQD